MRTSLTETEQIEAYLLRLLNTGDTLVFEARLLLEPELQDKMLWQQKTYNLITQYNREKMKQEIASVHKQLFTEEQHNGFRQRIMQLFQKK